MALNPNTLQNLYNKGLLDYVPQDLMAEAYMSQAGAAMTMMSNPYLEMAKQGGLYQSAGSMNDSFNYTGGNNYSVSNITSNFNTENSYPGANASNYRSTGYLDNSYIGSKSTVGSSMFSASGIGGKSPSLWNMFSAKGVGSKTPNGSGMFGQGGGIGEQSMTGDINSYGFGTQGNVQNGINNSVGKVLNTFNGLSGFVKGLLALGIGIVGLKLAFGGKKASSSGSGFLSKLNIFKRIKK